MKKLENFLKEAISIKEKTHLILGGAPTGGYSKPCPTAFSEAGSITYNSDVEGSAEGQGGTDGHESWGGGSGTVGCGSDGCYSVNSTYSTNISGTIIR